jgi:hypothetical protein
LGVSYTVSASDVFGRVDSGHVTAAVLVGVEFTHVANIEPLLVLGAAISAVRLTALRPVASFQLLVPNQTRRASHFNRLTVAALNVAASIRAGQVAGGSGIAWTGGTVDWLFDDYNFLFMFMFGYSKG